MKQRNFRKWGERDAPCLGCADRRVGCHGQKDDGSYRCEKYGAFTQQMNAEKQERKEWVDMDDAVADVRRLKGRR